MSDRVKGMFIGGFLGDALGAPHEFKCNSKQKYTGLLEFNAFLTTQYQGKKSLSIGQVTDDSEMTLALLRTILKDKKYIRENVIMSYIEWANSGGWMMGNNTKTLFKGIKTLRGYNNRIEKVKSGEVSQSNGSLMRCAPLSLLPDDDCIIQDVEITNPNPINIDCGVVYVNALRMLLKGLDKNSVIEKVRELATTDEVRRVFEDVDNDVNRDLKENKGWVLNALYCAFMSLKLFDNFSEAMKWIITQGGDTDTNASISGYLLGASLGLERMCEEKTTRQNIEIMLEVDVNLGPTPRPSKYTLKDIVDLLKESTEFLFGPSKKVRTLSDLNDLFKYK